ncbi:MAG: hypothetical protein EB084_09510, partial [Proteobacteria bacterium]|nr:hypothetical protein [Pseudomonadota bacterium]
MIVVAVSVAIARPGRPPVIRGEGTSSTGLSFRLSDAADGKGGLTQRIPGAPNRPLSTSEASRLLASLTPLPASADDAAPFKMRTGSLPAPRPGKTLPQPFPLASSASAPSVAGDGGLRVLRQAPYGPVALAPNVSVTFSNPMVSVTSLEDLAAAAVPLQLNPQPAGKWRWVGTRTLVFEPTGRMPMATEFTAVVPAGTKDAAGHALEKEVRWTFRTPAPHVTESYPQGGPHGRSPVMIAVFDQKVDPNAVLATLSTAPQGALRLATASEIDADPGARAVQRGAQAGRWVAFKAVDPFPTSTQVTVTVGTGTPSLEGPLKTDAPQRSDWRTYGPMAVEEAGCGYGGECPPLSPWHVRFTNPIDESTFNASMVTVTPALPGVKIEANGRYLGISGTSKGRTTYTVTLDPRMRDTFGQNLTPPDKPIAIHVGSARPALAGPSGSFILADPFAPPTYAVYSVNHPRLRVRLYRVKPEDWPSFATYMTKQHDETFPTPPGSLVSDQMVETKGEPDALTETDLDLRPAMSGGLGSVVVLVEPETQPVNHWERRYLTAWVLSSRIGLDAVNDSQRMTVSATSLTDGRPLEGVETTLTQSTTRGATDASGLATFDLPAAAAAHRVLVARKGDDVAVLPESQYWWSSGEGWRRGTRRPTLKWFVFDDRGIYKPKEQVHFKGWLRQLGPGPKGDVAGVTDLVRSVRYSVSDSRGNEVAKGDVRVGALGGFDGAFTLPDATNLGQATLTLSTGVSAMDGATTTHPFAVEEFRRPEFEVSATASQGTFVIGGHANVSAEAKYYAGGALPDAPVRWLVTSTPGFYAPPGHSEYSFGTWVPWFWWGGSSESPSRSVAHASRTDAGGRHGLRIDFDGVTPPGPSNVKAEATVTDVNRQAWSASASVLVHPARHYVGLKRDKLFGNPGDPIDLDVIVTDIDGRIVPGSTVRIHSEQLDYTWKNGRYEQTPGKTEETTVTSGSTPTRVTLHPTEGGTWRIRATIADPEGRANQSEIMFWVSGGKTMPSREVSAERLILVPDKKSYQPGDVAHILVQAPFPGGHGTLSLSRSGLIETRAFDTRESSATLDVPIDASYVPNLEIGVEVVGASERLDDKGRPDSRLSKRPAFALGSLTLPVPPLSRALKLAALPRDRALRPGSETAVEVRVVDASGRPVTSGEVAVAVVDESVLSLTGYRLDDPMNVFYALRGGDTQERRNRIDLQLSNPILALDGSGPRAQMRAEVGMNEAIP